MTYEEYKVIEQYFNLGELIQKGQRKIDAIERVNNGFISLNDIEVIQGELSAFGLDQAEPLELDKIIEMLKDELAIYQEAKKELIEHAKKLEIDLYQILFEKGKYESAKAMIA